MFTNNKLLTLTLGTAILSLAACGGGGSGSSGGGSVTISASVGSSYHVAYAPTFMDYVQDALLGKRAMAINSGTTVNQVVAIPTYQGHYGPSDLENSMQTATIGRDGSFSISLQKSYDWVLLLVNSNETNKADKVAGYVAATIDENNTLVAFAGSNLSTNLNLGTLENSGDEAKSSTTGGQTAASFDLTLDDLKAIAKSDGGYKHLINLYLNFDPVTKTAYAAQLGYGWNAGAIAGVGNLNPEAVTINDYQLQGFGIGIETSAISETLKDAICGMTTTAEMVPPGELTSTDGITTWDSLNGFKNDGSGPNSGDLGFNNFGVDNSEHWYQSGRYYCYDDDFSMQITSDFSNSLIGFGSHLGVQIPPAGMPEGLWVYKVGGTEVAWFDLAISSPINASGKLDTTPIPGIRLNYNNIDGEISGIEVKWFQYDAVLGEYVALTAAQIAAVESLVRETAIDIADEDGSDLDNPEYIQLYPGSAPETLSNGLVDGSSIVFPAATWYMPDSAGSAGKLIPTGINVSMHMGGVGYSFSWN